MTKIQLLDCTLRDGGYVNNWDFGYDNIIHIINRILHAQVEIIELGYLSIRNHGNPNLTQYASVQQVEDLIGGLSPKKGQDFAIMINYGEYPLEKLTPANESSPILRIAFHKKDSVRALEYIYKCMKKGYCCFVQPMGVLNYNDHEFLDLIQKVNDIQAKAFYIVDSFGVIELPEFRRLLFLADYNLKKNIILGYHAHNNLQQAYDNAKYMCTQGLTHDLVVDASVFGMGRGAGNLNIELFAQYLNNTTGKIYNIEDFLNVYDKYLKPIYAKSPWGYSLPFYLSAIHNVHPNYATYYSEKNTLSVSSLHELLGLISPEDRIAYSKEKAAKYYTEYLKRLVNDDADLLKLKNKIGNKDVIILAPGKSLSTCETVIDDFILKNSPIVIGVNSGSKHFTYDYLFITNEKRLTSVRPNNIGSYIKTSNLPKIYDDTIIVNYSSYLSSDENISDNPTLMLINLLNSIGISRINIAGFDGFSINSEDNYFEAGLSLGSSIQSKIERNKYIADEVQRLKERVTLNFITPSLYI